MRTLRILTLGVVFSIAGCDSGPSGTAIPAGEGAAVASTPTRARAADGSYISWREHIIDDTAIGGVAIQGSDGLAMGDLDGDGYVDIVSVHESDVEYDGVPDGHIRVAFGTSDPNEWVLTTLSSGVEAAAPEDVSIADLNGDGFLDIVAACELAHLIYFQNPGTDMRDTAEWPRLIPPATDGRGSYIRVFFADLTGDGKPEVLTPNKGAQNPSRDQAPSAISWFEIAGDPLEPDSWVEHELSRVVWPINSQPVDLDRHGDLDVIGGSVAETRIILFENDGTGTFAEHPVWIAGTSLTGDERPAGRLEDEGALVSGFNMDYVDLSGDGRLDIVTFEFSTLLGRSLVWIGQPETFDGEWTLHEIADYHPDEVVGIIAADINGDGRPDLMTGAYSGGARDADLNLDVGSRAGTLVWFENSGDGGWIRHEISRRRRGMFDKFVARDMDGDVDVDFVTTRGNSTPYDGVLWLEQVRTGDPVPSFDRAREVDSPELESYHEP